MPQPINLIEPTLPFSPIAKELSAVPLPEIDLHGGYRYGAIRAAEAATVPHAAIDPDGPLGRLLAAAVLNRSFCRMLLTNPGAALAAGYRGETFALSCAEKETLLQLRAPSLQELAQQLLIAIQEHNARL
jgi:hypothetical protein